ncbi:nucleotidyl transferase AbiEii/AbiGii toxin family protein [Candidatus Poribacteria bacterium]|nr:nucleotidyl transferase AbiEii/AbiGii toxin family protein [Candidatus Poribacteria bacterium]
MLELYDEFKALIAKLAEHKSDYALCGGLAMAVHGIPRATVDIDLLISVESLEAVKALAHELGYTLEAQPMKFAGGAIDIRRISKLDPDSGDLLMLDLLLVTPPIREVWESRIEVEWETEKLQVVSRAGLITLKSLRKSGQDLDDIKSLTENTDES